MTVEDSLLCTNTITCYIRLLSTTVPLPYVYFMSFRCYSSVKFTVEPVLILHRAVSKLYRKPQEALAKAHFHRGDTSLFYSTTPPDHVLRVAECPVVLQHSSHESTKVLDFLAPFSTPKTQMLAQSLAKR